MYSIFMHVSAHPRVLHPPPISFSFILKHMTKKTIYKFSRATVTLCLFDLTQFWRI
jgi:hypothetical protein